MPKVTITDSCTGCSSCYNRCPVRAIEMVENPEGFLYPVINKDKCINCGLCYKSCPINSAGLANRTKPKTFAFMAEDEIRKESASGGAFAVLANYFIKNDGYVSGAVWTTDWTVEHIISNNIDDVKRMKTSKYIQSKIGLVYKEIEKNLKSNFLVFFTGTPCQVAGLKTYLNKDYKNLYCADIVCHGVPSSKIFKKYMQEEFSDIDIKNINFRGKTFKPWGCNSFEIEDMKGYKIAPKENKRSYYKAFINSLSTRKSCSGCKYNCTPRQGDITIGDYWGINQVDKALDDRLGTSVVLSNNPKGDFLISILRDNAKVLRETKFRLATKKNPNIVRSSNSHFKREEFFSNLDKISLKENVGNILENRADCMIINFWSTVNYGAALTCYGVQCLMEKLGCNAKVINYSAHESFEGSFADKFGKKYLNLTTPIRTYADFLALNKNCNTFIAGSDQIWNCGCIKESHNSKDYHTMFLLDFVQGDNKRISYAASMGHKHFNGNSEDKFIFKHFISQFDSVSVREYDSLDVLKEDLNINNAIQLCDGAFHIPMDKLETMTQKYGTDEKYVAVFRLPYYEVTWHEPIVKQISEKLGIPIKEMVFDKKTPVEEWIAFIKNAEFVVADSYHACILAILFERPFVQIRNANSTARFDSLFKMLEIEDNSISKSDTHINFDKILVTRDWDNINKRIAAERQRAEEWMKNALLKEKQGKANMDAVNYLIVNSIISKNKEKEKNYLLANKNKILRQYYVNKVFSILTFFLKSNRFKEKSVELKKTVWKIKQIKKEG